MYGERVKILHITMKKLRSLARYFLNTALPAVSSGIWEGYKCLIVWLVTIYLLLLIVVGGSFHIQIDFKNVFELWHVIKGR